MPHEPHVPKIDPARRPAPAGPAADAPGNPAHREWAAAGLPEPDLDVIRGYRLERLRAQLRARDVAGALLTDPLNLRYALDAPNMQVWCAHNPVRYAFIAADGPAVLFDFHNCAHLSEHLPLIAERRPARAWFYFESGPRENEHARLWAAEIADLVARHGGGNRRLAIDKCDAPGVAALEALGVDVLSGQAFTEEARKLKHPEEIAAMRRALHTAETAMAEMWRALEPGLTENQLWSVLHAANIARGGEWIETRLLTSGPRTNPWFAECADRVIEAGDIVSFDTDLIGPYGYCADISRSWVTPGRAPNDAQRRLHDIALEMIAHNIEIAAPGVGFAELTQHSHALPEACIPNRYSVLAHGVGLCDEYPAIRYREDWAASGYDGVMEPGMVLCFEAYVGEAGGAEGVKLERQVLLTETGTEILDTFPLALVPASAAAS